MRRVSISLSTDKTESPVFQSAPPFISVAESNKSKSHTEVVRTGPIDSNCGYRSATLKVPRPACSLVDPDCRIKRLAMLSESSLKQQFLTLNASLIPFKARRCTPLPYPYRAGLLVISSTRALRGVPTLRQTSLSGVPMSFCLVDPSGSPAPPNLMKTSRVQGPAKSFPGTVPWSVS